MESTTRHRLQIDRYLNGQGQLDTLAADVRRGLAATPKYLLPKYFYDARGSALFERITELPEYYQTRTELAILQSVSDQLVAEYAFNDVVELGSGSSTKTRTLLDALERRGSLQRYVPVDVSETILQESAESLLARYGEMAVHAVVGDFQRHLPYVPPHTGRRVVLFLGSTIGNLDAGERQALLVDVRGLLQSGDCALIGVDLVKDVATLEAAYNDSAGVTADFNLNVLRVMNRELSADFALDAFRHHAYYNVPAARIEMHLIPRAPQTVRITRLDLTVHIAADETIWTENSYKFTRESFAAMLDAAGLQLAHWYTDPANRFGLGLAAPKA